VSFSQSPHGHAEATATFVRRTAVALEFQHSDHGVGCKGKKQDGGCRYINASWAASFFGRTAAVIAVGCTASLDEWIHRPESQAIRRLHMIRNATSLSLLEIF